MASRAMKNSPTTSTGTMTTKVSASLPPIMNAMMMEKIIISGGADRDADAHHVRHLHILNVGGHARDERGGRELVNVLERKSPVPW